MTNLNKINHLKKANKIKPIENLGKLIKGLKAKKAICCQLCEKVITEKPVVMKYGTFCSADCRELHYDHYILPDVEAAREENHEYQNFRRESVWA